MNGDTEISLELGQRVRDARKQLGLSQADLGAALGVTGQQVQKYETGHSRIAVDTLIKLADVLKVSPSTLIEGLGQVHQGAFHLTQAELGVVKALRAIPNRNVHHAIASFTQVLATAFDATGPKTPKQRS